MRAIKRHGLLEGIWTMSHFSFLPEIRSIITGAAIMIRKNERGSGEIINFKSCVSGKEISHGQILARIEKFSSWQINQVDAPRNVIVDPWNIETNLLQQVITSGPDSCCHVIQASGGVKAGCLMDWRYWTDCSFRDLTVSDPGISGHFCGIEFLVIGTFATAIMTWANNIFRNCVLL